MQLSVGTSGYSYKEWKGSFYPQDLAAAQMLRFYAERLPAVEINNTFYRMPRAAVIESWAQQVPEGFRFAIKASRRITHLKRLRDAGDETEYLLRVTRSLGERLGVLLFQLPPFLRKDLELLRGFLERLPEGTRAAFEFRHASWLDADVADCLRARGCALVCTDGDDGDVTEPVGTADFGYLRLRRSAYPRDALAGWARRVLAQDWNEAFVFFKHEDEGAGPKLAADFAEVVERVAARKPPRPAGERAGRREAV